MTVFSLPGVQEGGWCFPLLLMIHSWPHLVTRVSVAVIVAFSIDSATLPSTTAPTTPPLPRSNVRGPTG